MIPGLDDLRDRITELRTETGLTQAEAADAAGVSQSFVAKLESGDSVPNYRDAARLYNTLEERARAAGKTAADVMNADVVAVAPDGTDDRRRVLPAPGHRGRGLRRQRYVAPLA
ncbi:MAG: multiprotein-bridging factor 1 family protein [Candidatus Nanohaloarchaea archaeon]